MEFRRDRYLVVLDEKNQPVLQQIASCQSIEATDRLTQDEGLVSVRGGAIAKIKDGVVYSRGKRGRIVNVVHTQGNSGLSADNFVDVIYLANE